MQPAARTVAPRVQAGRMYRSAWAAVRAAVCRRLWGAVDTRARDRRLGAAMTTSTAAVAGAHSHPPRRTGLLGKIVLSLVAGVGVILLMLWLAGGFKPKVSAEPVAAAGAGQRPISGELVAVRTIRVPRTESAVGTIRAVHEASIAAEVLAKVVAMNVQAGQAVKKGDVLVKLDDEEFAARLRESAAVVAAVEAARDQAKIEYNRVLDLHRQNAAADIELQRADTALKDTEARLEQSRQSQRAAAKNLDNTIIRCPFDGVVIEKYVEVGDTVAPQKLLLTIYDPTRMQLVANVRESLINHVQRDQSLDVHIEAIDKNCKGVVTEIVPQSDIASRTFAVKVRGPCSPEIHSGMFGRLIIPLDEEEWLVIPKAAVRRVGQLDLVDVVAEEGGALERRVVRLGRTHDGDVEVLSGLRAGEQIAMPG